MCAIKEIDKPVSLISIACKTRFFSNSSIIFPCCSLNNCGNTDIYSSYGNKFVIHTHLRVDSANH